MVELRCGPQVIAGHVLAHPLDHRVDRLQDLVLQVPGLARLGRDRAEHRVTHHQRRLDRVQDDDRLAALGSADDPQRLRGGLGELVDVRPGAGAGRLAGDRGDDLGVRHGDDVCDGAHHRGGRLAATGDHVDVGGVEVEVEVDRRADVRPDRGRGEVDGEDAGLGVPRRVRLVGLGAGALEDDVRQLVLRQQPVDALVARLQADARGPAQPVGRRVDADHEARLDDLAAPQQLEHQVRADVAGTDDGGGGPAGLAHLNSLLARSAR